MKHTFVAIFTLIPFVSAFAEITLVRDGQPVGLEPGALSKAKPGS